MKEDKRMTATLFLRGWKHFCDCIDFGKSTLDAEAIQFMNDMPSTVARSLAELTYLEEKP